MLVPIYLGADVAAARRPASTYFHRRNLRRPQLIPLDAVHTCHSAKAGRARERQSDAPQNAVQNEPMALTLAFYARLPKCTNADLNPVSIS
ncbi:MAG: hypothetical protein ACJ8AW_42840 [Rhodopila sp.]